MQADPQTRQSARLLFAVTVLFWCAQYAYTPYVNPELEAMGRSAAFMGLVSGGYGLSQTILRLPLGLMADRMGRQKPFVITGALILALSMTGLIWQYHPIGILLGRMFLGAASASWVSFTILFAGYFPHDQGPKRITQLNLGNMGGRLIGYLLAMLLVPAFGVRSAFHLSLVCAVLALPLSFLLKDVPHPKQDIQFKELFVVLRDPYLIACSILGILVQMVAFSTYYGFTINAAKALGASRSDLSLMNIWMLIPTLITNWLVTSPGMRKVPARLLVFLGFVIGGIYCALVPRAVSMMQINLLQAMAGMSSSLTFAVLLGQCVRDLPQERRALGMGFHQAVYGIGMTIGPILTGQVIDRYGLTAAFNGVAVLALISAPLALWLMSTRKCPPVCKRVR